MKIFLSVFFLIPFLAFTQNNQHFTAEDIVNAIKKQVTCEWDEKTVDTFKAGDPHSKITGIVSCMFADMHVLRKAVELNCNFIITHEPVFYNHYDETESFKNDPVYQVKAKFIEANNLVIFRFHDHIHRTDPDGIYEGMLTKLNWKKNSIDGSTSLFRFPKTTVATFSNELKKKLGMESIRIIGDTELEFTKVGFAAGAPGGSSHIRMLRNPEIEVLVAGEAPEWETYLYANDAVQQNRNKAVIFLGHIKSEEAGMQYCADWLKKFIKGIPIHFVENEPNFTEL